MPFHTYDYENDQDCDPDFPPDDDDECTCDACRGESLYYAERIHAWDYRPRTTFQLRIRGRNVVTTDPSLVTEPCFGFEIEMEPDDPDDLPDMRRTFDLIEEMDCYAKSDGSLGRFGIEVVSQPMSLAYAQQSFRWTYFDNLRKMGWRSWDRPNCGMHVHVSRDAFAGRAHILRFNTLVMRNADEAKRYAHRSCPTYASFDTDSGAAAISVLMGKLHGYRYMAVNLTNATTVELRMFRGTMRPQRAKANIELVSALLAYTAHMDTAQIHAGGLNWNSLMSWARKSGSYPHLLALATGDRVLCAS